MGKDPPIGQITGLHQVLCMNLSHIDFHNPTLVECTFKLQISNICLHVYCLLQMLFTFQSLSNEK